VAAPPEAKRTSKKTTAAFTKPIVSKPVPKIDDAVAADRQLVDRCLAGDVAAWSLLYQQTHDSLLATIRNFLGRAGHDRNLVEEIAARVWYAVVKDDFALLARFDVRRSCRLSTFLSVLAKSETRMLFRSERRRRSREQLVSRPELNDDSAAPGALATDEEFLATLSPAELTFYRDVLVAPSDRRDLAEQGYSSENMWQLNYRVRKKLERFIMDSSS
jgi:hypothetical protein